MKRIETNTEKRWEQGIPHHPESVRIMEELKKIDQKNEDVFDWRCGGDGDNGEELMYQLDIIFERRDRENR